MSFPLKISTFGLLLIAAAAPMTAYAGCASDNCLS